MFVCYLDTCIESLQVFSTSHLIRSAKSVFWQVEEYSLVGVFVCFARVWAFVDVCVCVCVCACVSMCACLCVCIHARPACSQTDQISRPRPDFPPDGYFAAGYRHEEQRRARQSQSAF